MSDPTTDDTEGGRPEPGLMAEAGDRPRVDLGSVDDGTPAPDPEPRAPDDPEPSARPEDAEQLEDQEPGQPGGPLAEGERPDAASDSASDLHSDVTSEQGDSTPGPLQHPRTGRPSQE